MQLTHDVHEHEGHILMGGGEVVCRGGGGETVAPLRGHHVLQDVPREHLRDSQPGWGETTQCNSFENRKESCFELQLEGK